MIYVFVRLNTDIWLTYCEGSERLKEEYCPAEPEVPEEVQQPNIVSTPVVNAPIDVEDEPSSDEIESDYAKPLGVTVSTYSSDDSRNSEDNTAASVLVGTSATAAIIGLFYLATRDKEDEEDK